MFSTSCCSFEVSEVSIKSRRPPGEKSSGLAGSGEWELETGDSDATGSGVVAKDV